jgi:hypothetical protein
LPGEQLQVEEMSEPGVFGLPDSFKVFLIFGVLNLRFLTRGGDNKFSSAGIGASTATAAVVSWTTIAGGGGARALGGTKLGPTASVRTAAAAVFVFSESFVLWYRSLSFFGRR